MDEDVSDFNRGQWILTEREKKGWTQQALANKLGVMPLTVSRWERNLSVPRSSTLEKLGALFAGSAEEPEEHTASFPVAGEDFSLPLIYDHAVAPLPVLENGLIGRHELVKHLKLRFAAHSGAFALWGMYGTGKTTLAAALARDHELQAQFSSGILWAGLSREPGIQEIFSRWGTLLGLTSAEKTKLTSITEWRQAIRDKIGMSRMLIIIDDAWDAKDALAVKCGGLRCVYLLTTRSQEIALAFTQEEKNIFPVKEFDEATSLQLLQALSPELLAARDDARTLAGLAGGLPLALTIIGRYLHLEGVSDQPRRIRTAIKSLYQSEQRLRLSLLQPPSERPPYLDPDAPLSLYAVIEVIDQNLSARARYALHVLSVFPPKPNSFSEEAALEVGALQGKDLDTLIDTGLLESFGSGRYTLHQTISDYARLHLQAGTVVQDTSAVESRMALYFATFVEKHASTYALLEMESPNIIAALNLASERGNVHALVRGITAATPFLEAQGTYSLVEPCLQYIRQHAIRSEDSDLLAKACLRLGRIAQLGKASRQAEDYYEQGSKAARHIEDRSVLATIETYWGEVLVHVGENLRGEPHLREALSLTQELGGEPGRIALLQRILGEVESSRGNSAEATRLFELGLVQARQVNDYDTMSTLLQNLGVCAERSGYYQKAEAYYREGKTCAEQARHQQRISAIYMNMGMLAFKQKKYKEAESLYLESLKIARKIQVPIRVCSTLQNLGMLERVLENYVRAASYLQESLDIAYQIEHSWLISETLYEWGELHLAQNNLTEATRALEMALKIANDIEGKELVALAEYGLARVAQQRGALAEAEQLGKKSLEDFQGTDNETMTLVANWLEGLFPHPPQP